ncbi:hypothetical protein GCM10010873_16170 [Cypionkella aquatica]|uniref:Uncharacterized protein n=1 Tax=Cypionkella aquatica TaxID=1756042 RepID=A0AA37WZI1_9RHOB|nr:hypothetical protein GCM10010873_16170 [Cypionkella aquatica]
MPPQPEHPAPPHVPLGITCDSCPGTPRNTSRSKNSATPKFPNRATAPAAALVCEVDKTNRRPAAKPHPTPAFPLAPAPLPR